MDTRENIKGLFNMRPITEETSDQITPESIALDKLIGEELDAIRSYRTELETVQAENVKDRFLEIITDEQEHVRELAELASTYDQGVYNKYSTDPEFIEATAPTDKTVTEATSMDHSFTIEYKENGKTQYSSVNARTEQDALNLFNNTTKSQGRNVQGAKVVVQDTEIDESKQDDLKAKVKDYLNYHLSNHDEYIPTVRDIKVLGKSDDGTVTVEATYDAYVTIPYGEDPETGEVLYDRDTETRTDVVNIRESIKRVFKEALGDEPETTDQEYTSAATSINSTKLPALFKMVTFRDGSLNLDYGGGKFDNVASYLMDTYGATNLVYDPYNRTPDHNKSVLDQVRKNGGADTVTCSNVLNVIKEPGARLSVIRNCKNYLKTGGTAYFTVYEGSGTGEGSPTKSGYQLNKKTDQYVDEISQVFSNVTRKGKLIIAK